MPRINKTELCKQAGIIPCQKGDYRDIKLEDILEAEGTPYQFVRSELINNIRKLKAAQTQEEKIFYRERCLFLQSEFEAICLARKQDQEYRKKYPERLREKWRKWRAKHPEKKSEISKRYRERHPEKIKELRRRYKENYAEGIKERSRIYREKHREEIRERDRKFRKKNKKMLRKRSREYHKNNREKRWVSDILKLARRKLRAHFNNPKIRFRDLPGFCV